jgi:hypothetical protein
MWGKLICIAPNGSLYNLKHTGSSCRVGLHGFEQTEAVAPKEHRIDHRLWPGHRLGASLLGLALIQREEVGDERHRELLHRLTRQGALNSIGGINRVAFRAEPAPAGVLRPLYLQQLPDPSNALQSAVEHSSQHLKTSLAIARRWLDLNDPRMLLLVERDLRQRRIADLLS